jgi:nucleoid DNA-binding protein
MTKKDLARAIAERVGLPQAQARDVVQRVFAAVIEALVQDGRVELRNFGVFRVKRRRPRRARNPRTGEALTAPGRMAVTFRPGREMQQRVGRLTKVPGRRAVGSTPPQVSS